MPHASSKPDLSALPSVDEVLRSSAARLLLNKVGQRRLTALAREVLGDLRRHTRNTGRNSSRPELLRSAEEMLEQLWQRSQTAGLKPVINATGVVIHTNLGRAPLSEEATRALLESAGYCNIEYDLAAGSRGARGIRAESLVRELVGAEDAIVVNNCAAAAYLVLTALAAGREVVISRGELVEIGGEFRIPDVLARAGVALKEVGTTNRTRLGDYEMAIEDGTAMILKVHPSNYRIVGFTASPSVAELAALAHGKGIVLYEDAGSGAVADLTDIGLDDEPIIGESLSAGADVVTFSGDKLLGGPQAGIIAGNRDIIQKLRKDPLYRALRVSKFIYAALEATLDAHIRGRGRQEIPVLQMLAADPATLGERSRKFIEGLDNTDLRAEIVSGRSAVGGGAAPMTHPETPLIALSHTSLSANEIETSLRQNDTPIIVRIVDDCVTIDLRTVAEIEESVVTNALLALKLI